MDARPIVVAVRVGGPAGVPAAVPMAANVNAAPVQPQPDASSRACCAWRPSSTHRHATTSASTCKLSTLELHFHLSRADEMRAKRACQHTFTSTGARHSLTNHSTHAESSQPAHAQCAHITFATHSHCRDAVWRDLPAHVQRHMYTALLHDALAARARASVTAGSRACEPGRVGSQYSKFSV